MLFCEREGTLTSSVSLCIVLWGRHREGRRGTWDRRGGADSRASPAFGEDTHSGCVSVK